MNFLKFLGDDISPVHWEVGLFFSCLPTCAASRHGVWSRDDI